MNFTSISTIKSEGFIGFYSIAQLNNNSSLIPNENGVYMILFNESTSPIFINPGSGGFFKEKNPNVPVDTLNKNWLAGTPVIYIGKAGSPTGSATLNSRLKQYLKFGQGQNIGHYGGRYIWQIQNNKDLLICWKATPNKEPRVIEKELISNFTKKYHARPFANLVG